jgi:hypothetical protein
VHPVIKAESSRGATAKDVIFVKLRRLKDIIETWYEKTLLVSWWEKNNALE